MVGRVYIGRASAVQRLSISALHMENEWNQHGMGIGYIKKES
jgi:hypothetical protein